MLRLQKFQFPRNSVPVELEMKYCILVYTLVVFSGFYQGITAFTLIGKIRLPLHFFVGKKGLDEICKHYVGIPNTVNTLTQL